MAKLTLLDMVQDISSDLETDNVTAINDTVESLQIAQVIQTVFFEMIAHRNWPHLRRTIQLEAPANPTVTPTHLLIPERVKEVISLSYDKQRIGDTRTRYSPLVWTEPEEFLMKINTRDSSSSTVDTVTDFGGIDLYILNDRPPSFYTSFDDSYVVSDAYEKALDTSLQVSKTQLIVYETPVWTQSDAFIPDLPEEAFPALLSEAKSTAFMVLKQAVNQKEEAKAQRQSRWLSRKSWRVSGGVRYPDYGRKVTAGSARRNPMLDKG